MEKVKTTLSEVDMPKSGRRDEKAQSNGHAGEDISCKVEKLIRTVCSTE